MSDSKWKKGGETPNKYGRGGNPNKPKDKSVIKKSKLRALESNLLKLNTISLENIKKSVEGEKVDKETLSTSKWVITTTVMSNRAALAEEMGINKVTDPLLQEALVSSSEDGNSGFSLTMVKN